jgi:plasmid maintenance system antidote protein VapI
VNEPSPTGAVVRDALRHQRRSQQWLAERINITPKHMTSLIAGRSPLSVALAVAIESELPELTAEGLLLVELVYRVRIERERGDSLGGVS